MAEAKVVFKDPQGKEWAMRNMYETYGNFWSGERMADGLRITVHITALRVEGKECPTRNQILAALRN